MQRQPADEAWCLGMEHVDALLNLLQCFQCLWVSHQRLHRGISQLHTHTITCQYTVSWKKRPPLIIFILLSLKTIGNLVIFGVQNPEVV